MTNLDELGRRHTELQEELQAVREALTPAIRAEKAAGETFARLMVRSGYKSIETIRQIVEPKTREEINGKRRRRAANPAGG
jgi:hypothetical protein